MLIFTFSSYFNSVNGDCVNNVFLFHVHLGTTSDNSDNIEVFGIT